MQLLDNAELIRNALVVAPRWLATSVHLLVASKANLAVVFDERIARVNSCLTGLLVLENRLSW